MRCRPALGADPSQPVMVKQAAKNRFDGPLPDSAHLLPSPCGNLDEQEGKGQSKISLLWGARARFT